MVNPLLTRPGIVRSSLLARQAWSWLLVLLAVLGTSYSSSGQATYSRVPLTAASFTADVMANGSAALPPASSTTADVDGTGYYFFSQDYYTATTAHTSGIPNSGLIPNSIAGYSSLTYQLASLNANNSLRIPGGAVGTGTVTFATPTAASEVYVLASSGSAISTVDMTVNYSDGTTTTFTGQTIPDWFTVSATQNVFGMTGRASATVPVSTPYTASNTAPFFDQVKLTIPGAKTTVAITGITFSKTSTGGYLQVVAVSIGTYPVCTAPPTAGTAGASPTSLCAGGTATLTLTGNTSGTGLTYQWQSSTTGVAGSFTNITGATNSSYTTTALTQTTYYQAVVTCSGQSATSTVATVTVLAPTYATVPYTQGFETAWLSRCATNEAPDASWLNTPATGNASWRREDDGSSAGWSAATSGAYTPAGSNAGGASSSHSARFHNYFVNGTVGTLDLYVNMGGGTGTPTLKFDFRKQDTNAVVVLLSTDGGATFPTTLQTLATNAAWISYTIALPTTVTATTVIRFRATGNYNSYDNGLDNVSVSYISCAAATGLAATSTAAGATVSASIAFTPVAGATNYAFTISPAVTGAPTTVTASPISLTGLAYSTTYTVTLATNCGSSTSQVATYTFTTPCAPPTYATLPYTQGFESIWLSRCGTNDVPDNSWANTPVTGNNSWRRDDDGASASWTSPTFGAYTPAGSQGSSHSARFHSSYSTAGTIGTFDLYANLSATDTKRLTFDYVNATTSTGKLDILLSTDGGVTFGATPLLTINASSTFTARTVDLTTTSATAVIRFRATSDYGSNDIGVDNVQLRILPAVDIAPTALAMPTSTQSCYSSAETVAVTVTNQGSAALNFTTNPATVTAVVTTPGGPQTLTGSITTGTLAAGATQTVTLTPTLDMSALGTYTFAITATVTGDGNTTNDLLTPSPTRTVTAPVAGTLAPAATSICNSGTATLTLTGAANGSIQFQSGTSATGTFTNISGATSATYTTPVLTATTYYRAQVTCGTNVATSNVSTITVNTPVVASTNTPVEICTGNTATLTATPSTGALVRFFSAATGGTALTTTTAGSYTTPALTASTTYYAEAYTGGTENVGKTTSIQTDGGYSGSGTGIVFTANAPVTIQTATVYNATATAGSVSVELRDNATGTLITTAGPFAVAAGSTTALIPTVLPLNLVVPAAGTYRLVTAATPTPPTLYRDFSSGNTYPFTSPSGVVSVTGGYISGASTTYYFFFNLSISTQCIGAAARTPIQVNVTQPATTGFPAATAATCGTAAFPLTGTVTGSATSGTYTSSGTGTFSPNATTLNATYTPSAADVAAGTVTITLTSAAGGPCAAITATQMLTITPAPVATFSYPTSPASYCTGSASAVPPTLGTGATAGVFSSTTGLTIDATTGAITPSTSTPGTYTVTNTVAASGACAAVTATATVTITPQTTATFSYGGATFCVSGSNATASVTGTAGGTFSATPSGLVLDASTGTITAISSTPGTYTVSYAVGTACPSSATQTVTITTAPSATFSFAAGSNCAGTTGTITPSFGAGSSAGTFAATPAGLSINALTGIVMLSTSTAGTYTITNSIVASGGCAAATATQTLTLNAPPVATLTAGGATTFCQGSSVVLTAPAGTGNTYQFFNGTTSLGAASATNTLTASASGSYTVVVTNAATCQATSTATVLTVNPQTTATFSYSGSTFCQSGTTAPAASVTGTAGGTFSAPTGLSLNANTGAITLGTSTPGTYTVTYSVSGSCPSTSTQSVTITAAPVASFSYGTTSTYCVSGATNPAVALSAGASAGAFSSTTGLTLNATTGAITLASSTPGTYTVTNSIAAANGCAATTATSTLTITAAPIAAFTYPTATTYCAGSASTVTPTLGTGATAGTFASTTGLTINATTGLITLATSTAGTYTVTNTIAAANGCAATTATQSVTVAPATTATFSYAGASFCRTTTTAVSPTITGTSGGTFASTTGLTLNATTGAITPSTSTAGTYTVTYTVAGACGSTGTQSVTITNAPVATFTYPAATICAGQTATVTPTLGAGASAGTFASTTGLTINATTGVITPSTSTAGTYTVTNTIAAANGCTAVSSTQSVTILPVAVATFSYGTASTFCVSGATNPSVTLGTGATAGTFSSTTGLSLNAATGAITLASSTPGTYTVTNTVAASGTACGSTATSTLTITAAPLATFSYATTAACEGSTTAVTPSLGAGATAGTYSSTTGLTISATTGAITLSSSTPGTYTVTNTVAAAGGCAAATATFTFTVNPRPTAPVLSASYNGTTTTLTSSAASGNQFYFNNGAIAGATGTTYTVTGLPAQLGSYTVTTTNATTGCVSLPSNVLVVTAARNSIAGTSLRLFPNPTPTGQVTLELTGFRLPTQLTVLDALGRVVSSQLLPANAGTATHALDLSGVATGVYLLQLRNADGVQTQRLLRE